MSKKQKPKGPWINRFATRLFTLILAVLIFWLLGFLLQDIMTIGGPRYDKVEKRHVDQGLVKEGASVTDQLKELSRRIQSRKDEQQVVGKSSANLQQTIGQLIELKKLSIQNDVTLSKSDQNDLSTSLARFLKSQESFQKLNDTLSQVMSEKRDLEKKEREIKRKLEGQRRPARDEYNRLVKAHRLKLAGYQLGLLLPLLVVAATLIIRKRDSIYFPLFLAFGGATLVKVALVLHAYFPSQYFKYILMTVLLLAVGRLLIHFIRVVAYPKAQWLTKQYREAYERFLCPVCEYPIRTGPRKFLYWTRRTVHKTALHENATGGEDPYTCPSCGTGLFEECSSCHKTRHALLPHCQHCGEEQAIAAENNPVEDQPPG